MKILLAVDGSIHSDTALAEVAKRPWPAASEIKVITVTDIPVMVGMEPWVVSPVYFEELDKSIRQAAQKILSEALTRLKGLESEAMKITGEVIQGSPREVIVDKAEEWGADLIVIGSRGLGAWNRLLLGSVSNAVVQHAKCSVEIVRSPAANEKN